MKPSRLILLFLLSIPPVTFAEALFCVSEVATMIETVGDKFEAGIGDHSAIKLIQVKDGDSWSVRWHERNITLFDTCPTEFLCKSSSRYAGTFVREKNGRFHALILLTRTDAGKEVGQIATVAGKCSKI